MSSAQRWGARVRLATVVAGLAGGLALSSVPADGTPVGGGTSLQQMTQRARAGHVVARTDVDGDGARDVVRYRVIGPKKVRVLVALRSGDKVARVLHTVGWPGGHFQGAVPLDGKPGAELVIGTILGAHTPWYTVLTFRGDRLAFEHNPAASYRQWVVDAYANGYVGWTRAVRHGHAYVTLRAVFRTGTTHHWSGSARSFRWQGGQWVKAATHKIHITGDRRASHIGGWHVAGLPRWS
jgi:hypothetical protein